MAYSTTKETKENLRKINLKQSLLFMYNDDTFYTNYYLNINTHYKLYFNHKLGKVKHEISPPKIESYKFGGGFVSPFVTIGNIYEYGKYKYFYDMGKTDAWSLAKYEKTRWGIRNSILEDMPFGIQFSLPRFTRNTKDKAFTYLNKNPIVSFSYSLQNKHSKDTDLSQLQNVSAMLAYDFGVISSELLYKYSWRNEIVLPSSEEDSWLLTYPSALRLHQYMLFLSATFKRLTLLGALRYTLTDTTKNTNTYLLNLNYQAKIISFSAQFVYSNPQSIISDWKYETYLWSATSELVVNYLRLSYVKLRAKLAEYHQIMYEFDFPQSLYRSYNLYLKQFVPIHANKKDTQSKMNLFVFLDAGYSYTRDKEYIKQSIKTELNYFDFETQLANNTYWYFDEAKRSIDKTQFTPSVSLAYSFPTFPISLSEKSSTTLEMIDKIREVKNVLQTFDMKYKNRGLLISFGIELEFKFDNEIQSQEAVAYKILEKIKIQYNW